MMKRILKYILVSFTYVIVSSCAKDIVDLTGNIQGTVKDYNYGHLIPNCQVTLTPSGKSMITSSAGMFEFNDLEPGDYTLSFNKAGFTDETTRVTVVSGQISEVSVMLKAKAAFALSESVLDFGDFETTKVFYVYNNSDSDCSYTITSLPSWLSLSKSSGTISGGSQDVITATINRVGSEYGDFSQNITFAYSGKATGTTTLLVKYQKVQLTAPSVSCSTNAENITQNSFEIQGNIIATGGSQILSYGHCWNTTGNPTINDNKSDLGAKTETGSFKTTANNLNTNTTYYVRAYAKNALGLTYSDQVAVCTQDVASNKWDGTKAKAFAGGSGSFIDPYQIETGSQLVLIKDYSSKYFELNNDINLDNIDWPDISLSGSFDGKGHTISNLKISRDNDNLGLFSLVSGTVKNLTLRGVNIQASSGKKIGALAGRIEGKVIIDNCTVIFDEQSHIMGDSYVGGAIGYCGAEYNSPITLSHISIKSNSSNYVILCNEHVGGLVGYKRAFAHEMYTEDCHVNVNINGGTNVGGLYGGYMSYSDHLTRCSFKGTIKAVSNIGGIVGILTENSQGVLYASESKADTQILVLDDNAGGFIGKGRSARLQACYSSGIIQSDNLSAHKLGGIIGYKSSSDSEAELCYSTLTSNASCFDSFDGVRTKDCTSVYDCDNITSFIKTCYSNLSDYYNFDNTWTWTGTIDGNELSVSCPRLSWE